jgi:hypothetical protein
VSFIEGADPSALADRLAPLVPGVTVSTRYPPGAVRRFLRSAASQTRDMTHLDVSWEPGAPRLRLAVPDRPDLVLGNVAQAVRTVVEVRRLFGPAATHINELSFDQAEQGFRSGRIAGTAHTNLGHIHLNASFIFPGGAVPIRRIEATTAHECWHQIEHHFEMSRFGDSIEFRRALGLYFGVETLERVVTGGERGAPPAERAAYERLIAEVSAYATTNIRETTAEMMKVWWCAPAPPPPIAVTFGRLMERFFGVHRG